MQISKSQLRVLIENLLFEEDKKVQGKIILGFRSISGPDFEPGSGYFSRNAAVVMDTIKDTFDYFDIKSPIRPGHSAHAFVYVEDESGKGTTYSGKSGIIFTASEFLKRLSIGRDLSVDEKLTAIKDAYEAGKVTKKEFEKVLKTTSWGPLTKLKNWDLDSLQNATELYQIMPLKTDTQEDLNTAASKIKSAFENYKEDVPYDPLPGTEDAGGATRNSNSFAYTLTLEALGSEEELMKRTRGFDASKLPGWGYKVPGLSSGTDV